MRIIVITLLFVSLFSVWSFSYMIDADVGSSESIIEAGIHPTMLLNTDNDGAYFTYEKAIGQDSSINAFYQSYSNIIDQHIDISLNRAFYRSTNFSFAGGVGITSNIWDEEDGSAGNEYNILFGVEATVKGFALLFIPLKATLGIYSEGPKTITKLHYVIPINDNIEIPLSLWTTYGDGATHLAVSGIIYRF